MLCQPASVPQEGRPSLHPVRVCTPEERLTTASVPDRAAEHGASYVGWQA